MDTPLLTNANTSEVYTKTQMDTSFSTKSTLLDVSASCWSKANSSDVYTKTQKDTSSSTNQLY